MPDIPCPHCGQANEPEREICWACNKLLSGDDRKAAKVEAAGAIPETPRNINPSAPSSVSVFGITLPAGDPSDPKSFWGAAVVFLLSITVLSWLIHKEAKLHLDGRITTGTCDRRGYVGSRDTFAFLTSPYYYHYTVPGDRPGEVHVGRTHTGFLGFYTEGMTFPVLYSASDPDDSRPAGEGWLVFLIWSAPCLVLAVLMFILAFAARGAAFNF